MTGCRVAQVPGAVTAPGGRPDADARRRLVGVVGLVDVVRADVDAVDPVDSGRVGALTVDQRGVVRGQAVVSLGVTATDESDREVTRAEVRVTAGARVDCDGQAGD